MNNKIRNVTTTEELNFNVGELVKFTDIEDCPILKITDQSFICEGCYFLEKACEISCCEKIYSYCRKMHFCRNNVFIFKEIKTNVETNENFVDNLIKAIKYIKNAEEELEPVLPNLKNDYIIKRYIMSAINLIEKTIESNNHNN